MFKFSPEFVNFTQTLHQDTYPFTSSSDHRSHAVLITGASRGIGKAIAPSFTRAGASSIAIAARSDLHDLESSIIHTSQRAGHAPPKVLPLALDVTDEAAVSNAAAQAEAQFGHLDILVNNAGRLEALHAIGDSDPSEWWRTCKVNLKGTYLVTRAFLPLLLRGQGRTIVNMSSIGAIMQTPGMSGYQISKSAVLRFTDLLASEYRDQGILSFAMYPGPVATDLIKVFLQKERGIFVNSPGLCGDTIAWLTQERRQWLAGRLVGANWDMAEFVGRREEIENDRKLKMEMVL
ncbi:oxidoreductase [Aspergillus steynii IBT 23096]|uniref:Oxidoreductase n=1 Tax=Aspergillus steynii IBT 23096 TaxID=1392250 RepID=A0A2I2GGU6_9EURO|nr:oxidoreductase [Aspergillus steynii IBT 23096]PLB52100.1 oxidoreductase [Aspergillus steynii IBT 23096]